MKKYKFNNRIIFVVSIFIFLFLCFSNNCDKNPSNSTTDDNVITILSGNEQSGIVGDTLPTPLSILVHDKDGNAVINKRIDFIIIDGEGSLTDDIVMTDQYGNASTRLILGNIEGIIRVKASIYNSDNYVIFNAIIENPINSINFVDHSNISVNPDDSIEICVEIKNITNIPVKNILLHFEILNGLGALSISDIFTDSVGRAISVLTV